MENSNETYTLRNTFFSLLISLPVVTFASLLNSCAPLPNDTPPNIHYTKEQMDQAAVAYENPACKAENPMVDEDRKFRKINADAHRKFWQIF